MRMTKKITIGVASLLAPLLLTAPAQAATIIGGATSVTLTAAPTLTGLGLAFAPFGTASAVTGAGGIPTVTFLVTGGTVNDATGKAMIMHNGSGLRFTAAGKVLTIGDFLINTTTNVLTGTVVAAGGSPLTNVPLFNIGNGLSLSLTSQAAGAFTTVFGAPNLTGAAIGTASTSFVTAATAVPEPASWGMMLLGFGIVGTAIRTRNRRMVPQTC
jgi:PEP-CTERM motif